jgi:hypothetical protein
MKGGVLRPVLIGVNAGEYAYGGEALSPHYL